MNTELSRIESALITALSLAAAGRAGMLAREAGYPALSEEQGREMTRLTVQALSALVVALREPGGPPSAEELTEVVEGVAQGAVLGVLGTPPGSSASMS